MFIIKNQSNTLYGKIYDDIVKKIGSGELKPGDRLPTEFELIDSYNVSRITVIRALQELVKSGKIIRYRSRGSFVKETAIADINNTFKSTFVRRDVPIECKNSRTIALVLPFSTEKILPLLDSIQQSVQQHNYFLAIFNSDRSVYKEREILKQIFDSDMAGVICYPIESYENVTQYSNLIIKGIPFVTIDKPITYFDIPCVKTDNFSCAYKAVEYLISKGHKNIAYYCHTLKDGNENLRFSGYLKALIDNGITPHENYFMQIEPNTDPKQMVPENSMEIHNKVHIQMANIMSIEKPPTAIFCAFDLIGAYVEQQVVNMGVRIPEDVSIMGFDNLTMCDHLQIPMTSLAQDYDSIGNKAVELLLEILNGKNPGSLSCMFGGEIVERQSVKENKI